MQFLVSEVAAATGGRMVGVDREVDGLAIDSRLVAGGELFAAIVGERDGHDFVGSALSGGASAALVERVPEGLGGATFVVVDDMATALAGVARLARSRLGDRVVGVTGSVGKTTTKDLTRSVLSQRFVTSASEKSFNNELGVPMTLMNAPAGTEATIVEMGARGVGHIAHLCSMAAPTVGVVTTVEAVHTETMGGIADIARVKGELIEALPPDGLAVLNADVPVVAELAARTDARVLTFGRDGDVSARDVVLDGGLVPSFVLVSPWGEVPVRLGVRGAHNVMNALAAAAVGLSLGVPLEDVASGLASAESSPWRMEVGRLGSGATLINDCYNAGPASMRAALEALRAIDVGTPGRRYAVLGVMAELGERAPDEHADVASLATGMGIEVLAVGTDLYGSGAAVTAVEDTDEALEVIESWALGDGDAVLVKGSRVAGLERVADALRS